MNLKFPLISDKLIDCLESLYPNKLPLNQVTDFQLGILLGQQQVINKLKTEKEIQENNELPLE